VRQPARRSPCGADHWLPDGSGEAMVFSVTPIKVFTHAKGDPFGAAAHRFGRRGQSR